VKTPTLAVCSKIGAAALLLPLAACEAPLKAAQLLEEARILGVRIVSEDGQASLERGQSALLDVLVAGPAGTLDAQLAYELCVAAESQRGVPFCEAGAFAKGTAALSGAPLAVEIPATTPPGAALALLGVACLSGEPQLGDGPLDWSCSGGEAPLRLSFDAQLSTTEFSNLSPDLSQLELTVEDVMIPLDDVRAPATCEDDAAAVAASTTHRVEMNLGAGARDEASETLQVSLFSTSGVFEHHYRFVEPGQSPSVSLDWKAAGPGPVKQYVVVRDGRGGVSWASFSFCAR